MRMLIAKAAVGAVGLTRLGDTLTVTLRRHRSTPSCAFFSFLTARMVAPVGNRADDARLFAMNINCLQDPSQTAARPDAAAWHSGQRVTHG